MNHLILSSGDRRDFGSFGLVQEALGEDRPCDLTPIHTLVVLRTGPRSTFPFVAANVSVALLEVAEACRLPQDGRDPLFIEGCHHSQDDLLELLVGPVGQQELRESDRARQHDLL